MIRMAGVRLLRGVVAGTVGSLIAFIALLPPSITMPQAVAHRLGYVTQDLVVMVIGKDGGQGSAVVYTPGTLLTSKHVVIEEGSAVDVYMPLGRWAGFVECTSGIENDFAIVRYQYGEHSVLHEHPLEISLAKIVPGQVVLIAGYEFSQWASYATIVKMTMEYAAVEMNGYKAFFSEIITVENRGRTEGFGLSGGGVFDVEGRLIGIICCSRPNLREIGFVPINRGLLACRP